MIVRFIHKNWFKNVESQVTIFVFRRVFGYKLATKNDEPHVTIFLCREPHDSSFFVARVYPKTRHKNIVTT